MSKLWETVLNIFNFIGDNSGCHQIPERCFTIKGYTFPICARCTGVFLGQLIFVFTIIILGLKFPLVLGFCFASIMAIDWAAQYFSIKKSSNLRRFVTGILGGFGFWDCIFLIAQRIIFLIAQKMMGILRG